MELRDEGVAVGLRKRHECAAHDYVLYFVDAVAEAFDLLNAAAGLFVGIVAGADGAHRGGFVACVGLGGVFEVAVGPAGAVDANVACVGYVWTAVGFAHYCHDSDAGGGADGFGDQFGEDIFLVMLGYGGDDGGQRGLGAETVPFGDLSAQAVEIEVFFRSGGILLLLLFIVLDEGAGDVGAGAHEALIFWWELEVFGRLALGWRWDGQSFGRHVGGGGIEAVG